MKTKKTLHIFFFISFTSFMVPPALPRAQTPKPSTSAPQQIPVFRSGTDIVPLTVTVLDAKGVPVRDLTAADFTVSENGKTREIVNFFPQDMKALKGTIAPVAGMPRSRADGLTPQTGRTFLIVLAAPALVASEGLFKMFESGADFVRHSLLPQDAVGVLAFNRVTPLTLDHEAIARIIERYKEQGAAIRFDDHLSRETSFFGNSKRPTAADVTKRMEAMMAGAGPVRNISDLLLGMDVTQVKEKPGYHRETVAELLDELQGYRLDDLVMDSARMKLFAAIEYLRYVDGEKHLLFLSSARLAHNADDAVVVGQRAADARVVVDVISDRGLNLDSRDVVDMTGGYYTSLEYPRNALAKLDTATRFSYLLGYTPVNPELDGRFRDVKVKVNRPGVSVRFEHGYFANAEPDPIEIKSLLIKARLDGLLAYDSQVTDIPLSVSAFNLPRMGLKAETSVEIYIDATKLELKNDGGRHTGKLELQVYTVNLKKMIVGEAGQEIDLNADDDTFQIWQQTGIRRVVRVPVTDPPKYVKVLVYDYGSDRAGSFMFTIK